jgi:uncharacterized protein (TIGR00299 family) protein
MKIAYFDCISGISGNMILGALINAGLNVETLRGELAKLNLDGYSLTVTPVNKNSIAATLVDVDVSESGVHRHLPDIEKIIDDSTLPTPIKVTAKSVFQRLAQAEAQVHGTTPDHIHFHEVGGMDAIIDIVGAAIGLSLLGIDQVLASPIPTGHGWVNAAHGRLPIPAPATAILLQGVPLSPLDVEAELTTPTGAAIITTVAARFGLLPAMMVEHVGYGAGHRDLTHPNVLRVMIGHLTEDSEPLRSNDYEMDTVTTIEANIDNMNPEFFDHVMTRLLQGGAVDVFLTPIQMKRNRPATLLSVLAPANTIDDLIDILFAETTTLGVRTYETRRRKLSRRQIDVKLIEGDVRVKVASLHGEVKNVAPEYVDCRTIAEETGQPLKTIYDKAKAAALATLTGS